MSSDEEVYTDSEEEIVPVVKKKDSHHELIKRTETKASVFDEQLKDYILEWRKQKTKEEEDLKRLKEKQARRKVSRAEEEKRMAERKKQEEERRQREAEEKKQRDIEAKKKRLEEAEKKRQAMLAAAKESCIKKGPNFTIIRKDPGEISPVQVERSKTKEQIEEEKRISLSFRIKPLNIEGLALQKLQQKAKELWDQIVRLETDKYDLEERQKRQDYDLKELKERQKQQLTRKAVKKGLNPEALTGKYPPKIQVASKYERRVDTRSYDERKKLFDGGQLEINKEFSEKNWSEKVGTFENRPKCKLPKWFGERPGKKKEDPETPEEEEVKKNDDDFEEPTYRKPYQEEEEEEEEEEYEEEEEEEEDEEE